MTADAEPDTHPQNDPEYRRENQNSPFRPPSGADSTEVVEAAEPTGPDDADRTEVVPPTPAGPAEPDPEDRTDRIDPIDADPPAEPVEPEPDRGPLWRRALLGTYRFLLVGALPLGIYTFLGMLRIGPVWKEPTQIAQCGCGDGAFVMWFLGWTPFAVGQGRNPFFSDYLFSPEGLNTLWNVSLPLPGMLLAPLTDRYGVALSYNVLVVVAFAGSAATMYFLLRRWVSWAPAAFVGGLLYGFSPYMIGQGLGHLHMVLLVLVPVAVALIDDILVRQRWPWWVTGPLLGITVVAQFFVAVEVLASFALVCVLGLLVLMALFPVRTWRKAGRAALGLNAAAVTALVLAAYPLYYQLTGPQALDGTVSNPDRFRADLYSWIVPTRLVHFAPDSAIDQSAKFSGNLAENGAYLGIPLLLLALVTTIVLWRRRPMVRWAFLLLVVVMAFASGPSLFINGEDSGIWMPLSITKQIPLLESIVGVRLAAYAVLLCAILLALALDAAHAGTRALAAKGSRPRWFAPTVAPVLPAIMAIIVLLPVAPWSYRYGVTDTHVPQWFRSSAALERVPAGSVALTVPYAWSQNAAPLLWQAETGFRYRSPFGYALHPAEDGKGTFNPDPSTTTWALNRLRLGRPPRLNEGQIRTIRAEFARWNVRTVVLVTEANTHVANQRELLVSVLGRAPTRDAGADVWYDVDPVALANLPVTIPPWPWPVKD